MFLKIDSFKSTIVLYSFFFPQLKDKFPEMNSKISWKNLSQFLEIKEDYFEIY